MDIITDQSQKLALEMLSVTVQHPDLWRVMKVQLSPLHRELLDHDGLSHETIDKMHRISDGIAQSLNLMGLDLFTGKIYIFPDGDILAFYKKNPASEDYLMHELRKENHLIHFMLIEPVNQCRQDITRFIRSKNNVSNACLPWPTIWSNGPRSKIPSPA